MAQQVNPDFYEGLIAKAAGNSAEDAAAKAKAHKEAAASFEKALNSSNAHIRGAAAGELLSLRYAGTELSRAAMVRVRQEASGSWAAALNALDAEPALLKEAALSFLLGSGSEFPNYGNTFPDEAAFYALGEYRSQKTDFFSESENAAIEGHIAASRSRFSEALAFFRITLNDGPRFFFRYPDLLNDLGRSFQYTTATGSEGIDLFLKWEKAIAEGENIEEIAPGAAITGLRFRLLFFAARIARQRGLAEQGIDLFLRALPFAPDSGQTDACIWYVLDSSMGKGPAAVIRRLEALTPQWHSGGYFSDVLDKLSRELVTRRQWKELIQVFSLIRSRSDLASKAKYAYIIGRSITEGYFSPAEIRLAAAAADSEITGGGKALAKEYLRIAHDAGAAAFYYHTQSAAALDEPFLTLPQSPAESKSGDSAASGDQSAAMEFLLGFFGNHAADFALPYIRAFEKNLSAGDLRLLAGALDKAGLYMDSMRLVSSYAPKDDYEPERRDLELMYPRPFRELVETYAKETGIVPELLYGLIRTESAFQSNIVSRAGAVGLTQLMPATAREMAARIRRRGGPDYMNDSAESGDSPLNLSDPAANIHIGAVYLAYLREQMKDPLLALLAYNGGMNRVRRWRAADSRARPGGLPVDLFLETIEYPETREYGRKVLAATAVYRELYYAE